MMVSTVRLRDRKTLTALVSLLKPYSLPEIMLETKHSMESVKEVREAANMTQQQIAQALGVGLSTWKRWEAVGKFPRMTFLQGKKLSELASIPIEDLPQDES